MKSTEPPRQEEADRESAETERGDVACIPQAEVADAADQEISDKEVEEGLRYFLSWYREHMLDNTVTYPGGRHFGSRRRSGTTP